MPNNVGMAMCDEVFSKIQTKLGTGANPTMDDLNAQALIVADPISDNNPGDTPQAPGNALIDISYTIDGIFS